MTGVGRDKAAVQQVRAYLNGPRQQCLVGRVKEPGLPDGSATVVYGETMRSMQTPGHKDPIVREAARLLRSGGRYGIHELSLKPDDLAEERKDEISPGAVRRDSRRGQAAYPFGVGRPPGGA